VKLVYLVLLCAVSAQAAGACVFKSNLSPFPAEAATLVDTAELPAPEIEATQVTRGLGGGATCDALGFLSVQLRWPRGSRWNLEQIGFEYRLVSGEAPDGMLPDGIVRSPATGRRAEHQFTWPDGTPDRQQALRLQLEVRAVTPDRQRGPPVLLRIDASPGS